ncbi:LysR family transcriptional regulator [Bradyrhizobium sp. U87765 SZCCT0131]|uniref:LysR family transcriptional regulator n=1 Tax=unclassified Bradyrhizobium TaxID=2631580 RepID=UPI001BA64035|nr:MULTISPECIES: LysR family transcriptional regulator [unclassified Bradyrhizobium]MBR1219151.1 LysR family transcriptional regulator [Bradyrhizobium sp. U87765 SZCCT0131]MBR1261802.1 LysR family transcriptional regulator [Bradyrhizobium sp. U87765 SZCCT0134]MBR1306345.1 LysR family transcriptional regulator [Bradyrhizobium sp. U87765 SZCCT0110]MBR1317584.1 LysR family transcriptional regulator [Bradyrhizobium sp. U87765 SZCCT0109]MBR1351286.1 LysR family transcriptional regulator [Bradyrhizo
MQGTELAELATFLAVARHRSFRKAAIARNVAPSAISHTIRSLETRVGVRLLHRTTRSVSLTEAGERLLAGLTPAFGQIGQAVEDLNAFRDTPFGTVRLTLPRSLATVVMRDVMGPLLRQNPGLHLDIVATDRLLDIVEDGFDAGIRFGERLSEGMVAVRLKARVRFAVVGAPAYFREHPPPLTPADLRHHACIRYRFPSGAIFNWEFARGDEALQVEVDGPLTLDDQALMIEAARDGCGLAMVSEHQAAADLAAGRLARCLEDWCPEDDSLHLYYPSRRHMSAGLRALIDRLKAAG